MRHARTLLLVLLAWVASATPAMAQINPGGGGGQGSSLPGLGSLTDPNADRILFWDDSAGRFTFLTLSGCSITGTVATCGAGTATSSGAANEIQVTDNGGGFTTYAGTACTNQALRALAVTGVGTCVSITNAYVDAAAAIAYSKLALTGAILNADLAGSIASSKLVGTDITIVGTIATGVWSGTAVAFAKGGTGLTTAADDTVMVSSGSAWVAKAIADCTDTGGNHLNYTASTNSFSCGTTGDGGGGGGGSVSDTAYDATTWNGDTTNAPSKNAVRDLIESFCTATDPGANTFVVWDDTDNACAMAPVGSGLNYTHATHTIAADVTLNNSATITGKTINGLSNTLTVQAATQLSGFIPVSNICTATNADSSHFLRGDCTWQTIAGGGDALTASTLAQFAATTSAELAGVLTNETGTSLAVFNTNPTLVVPLLNGLRTAYAAKTADYTVGASDHTITADATGSSVTITLTLPTAASVSGREYQFVRIDADADGSVILDGNSTETIDGATTYSMPFGTATTIKSNGTNWVVTGSSGQALADPGADRIVFWDDSAGKLDFLSVSGCSITTTTLTCTGTGTVTATGGSLTSNALVLGAGTVDTKVSTGLTTDGTAKLIVGVDSTTAGTVKFWNATSGSVTLTAVTGALGTVTVSLPAATGTIVLNDNSATLTTKTINAASNTLVFPITWAFTPAVCQGGATASGAFNTQTAGGAAAACFGTTITGASLAFTDDGATVIEQQFNFDIPSDWDGSSVVFGGFWYSTATSGNAIWNIKGVCAANDEAIPTAYSSTPDSVTDATLANASRQNSWTITATAASNHPFATCSAGEHFYGVLYRDPSGSDTISATASLLSMNVTFSVSK